MNHDENEARIEQLSNQVDIFLFEMQKRPEMWQKHKRKALHGRDPVTYEDHVEMYNVIFRERQNYTPQY